MSHSSIDEALDLEFSPAHAGSFVQVDLCRSNFTGGQLTAANPLHFRQRPLWTFGSSDSQI
jgi:hypothetical protein